MDHVDDEDAETVVVEIRTFVDGEEVFDADHVFSLYFDTLVDAEEFLDEIRSR